jgi:hypothetical protein
MGPFRHFPELVAGLFGYSFRKAAAKGYLKMENGELNLEHQWVFETADPEAPLTVRLRAVDIFPQSFPDGRRMEQFRVLLDIKGTCHPYLQGEVLNYMGDEIHNPALLPTLKSLVAKAGDVMTGWSETCEDYFTQFRPVSMVPGSMGACLSLDFTSSQKDFPEMSPPASRDKAPIRGVSCQDPKAAASGLFAALQEKMDGASGQPGWAAEIQDEIQQNKVHQPAPNPGEVTRLAFLADIAVAWGWAMSGLERSGVGRRRRDLGLGDGPG